MVSLAAEKAYIVVAASAAHFVVAVVVAAVAVPSCHVQRKFQM